MWEMGVVFRTKICSNFALNDPRLHLPLIIRQNWTEGESGGRGEARRPVTSACLCSNLTRGGLSNLYLFRVHTLYAKVVCPKIHRGICDVEMMTENPTIMRHIKLTNILQKRFLRQRLPE